MAELCGLQPGHLAAPCRLDRGHVSRCALLRPDERRAAGPTLCACPTVGELRVRAGVYHCSTCGLALPAADDTSEPDLWRPGEPAECADCLGPWAEGHACSPYALDGRGEAKVLRVVAVERRGSPVYDASVCFGPDGSAGAHAWSPPPTPTTGPGQCAHCGAYPPLHRPEHVYVGDGTPCVLCGRSHWEACGPPPKAAPIGGPAAFYAAVKVATEKGHADV